MTAGSQLQGARSARKLSLAEVTKATKIQPWVLEALEADRLQEMMSPIYVKGFLASYARFLRLDPEPLLARVPWPKPDPVLEDMPPAAPAAPMAFQVPWPLLRRFGTGLILAAVAAGVIIVNPLKRMSKISLPALSLPKLAKMAPEKPSRAKPTPKKVASAKPAASASAANEAVKVSAPKSAATAAIAKPVAQPSGTTNEAVKPATAALASVTPLSEPVQLPAPAQLSPAPTQPLELRVTANRTTWIRVRADGKLVAQQRLPRGANERWTAKKQFELVISKPTEVELTLNGQPISPFAVAHKGRVLITHRGVSQLPEED